MVPSFRLPPSCQGTSKRGRAYSPNLLLSRMRWPRTCTLIMDGFTKSNFFPRSWERNYESFNGSSSSSSYLAGSPAFSSRDFIYSVTFLQQLENGLRPSRYVW
jgi:hypothetical protein